MIQVLILAVVAVVAAFTIACAQGPDPVADHCEVDPVLVTWMVPSLADSDALVFGELHGTKESPAVFKRMVCASLALEPSVLIGLELPESAIDAVRELKGAPEPLRVLGDSEFWSKAHDGRTSVAMFELVEWLVSLEATGRVGLAGYDLRVTGSEPFGTMAGLYLRQALAEDGQGTQKFLVLTGRGHSDFQGGTHSVSEDLASNGMRTLSVDLLADGGTSWVCRAGSCGISDASFSACEPGTLPGTPEVLDAQRRRAAICLGRVSSSAPRVP